MLSAMKTFNNELKVVMGLVFIEKLSVSLFLSSKQLHDIELLCLLCYREEGNQRHKEAKQLFQGRLAN